VLASIPSPDSGILHVGPVPLHMYGLMLAIGVLVAVRVSSRRWVAKGHALADFDAIVIWVVVAGVVGARAYHVISDYQLFTHDWLRAFEIWRGGLSIWGAVGGGAIAVIVLAKRRHLDLGDLMDSMAPGVVLAQAIGRWGNWWNQELFGGPSSLPWAVEIDASHRHQVGYTGSATTFQPTFLYESLYCLAIFVALLWIERRFRLVKGQLCALYVALYTAGRVVFEEVRIDPAHTIGPLRLNAWLSIVLFALSVATFVWLGRRANVTAEADPSPSR
jgi:prolipoprotein diacylglyceryl transferase